jgi:hypothetical protein
VVEGSQNVTLNHKQYLPRHMVECTVANSEPDPHPVRRSRFRSKRRRIGFPSVPTGQDSRPIS